MWKISASKQRKLIWVLTVVMVFNLLLGCFSVRVSAQEVVTTYPVKMMGSSQAPAADKNILVSTILEAEKAINNGNVDKLIPSVKQDFTTAYQKAIQVNNNSLATVEEVQAAFNGLLQAIWKLDYIKADKSVLNEVIRTAESKNLNEYTANTVKTLQDTLTKAKVLMANQELTTADQDGINTASRNLQNSLNNLVKSSGGSGWVPPSSNVNPPASSQIPPSPGVNPPVTSQSPPAPGKNPPSSSNVTNPIKPGKTAKPSSADSNSYSSCEAASSASDTDSSSNSESNSSFTSNTVSSEAPVSSSSEAVTTSAEPDSPMPWGIILIVFILLAIATVLICLYFKKKKN